MTPREGAIQAAKLGKRVAIIEKNPVLGGTQINTGTIPSKALREAARYKATDMLQFDLDNEMETIANYRERIRQAEGLGEYVMCEVLREIIAQEQEHAIDLATALGIDVPETPPLKGEKK